MHAENFAQNLQSLIQKNPSLTYVLPKLAQANLRYGLYAGAHTTALFHKLGVNLQVRLLIRT